MKVTLRSMSIIALPSVLIACVAAPTYDAPPEPGLNVYRTEDVRRTNNNNYNSNTNNNTINNIIEPGQNVYRTEEVSRSRNNVPEPRQQQTSYPNTYSTPETSPSKQDLTTTDDDDVPEPGQQQMNYPNTNTVPEPGQTQMTTGSGDDVPEPGQTEMKGDDDSN